MNGLRRVPRTQPRCLCRKGNDVATRLRLNFFERHLPVWGYEPRRICQQVLQSDRHAAADLFVARITRANVCECRRCRIRLCARAEHRLLFYCGGFISEIGYEPGEIRSRIAERRGKCVELCE